MNSLSAKDIDSQILLTVIETAKLGAWKWDLIQDTVSWSSSLIELFGLRDEDSQQVSILEQTHPEDRAFHRDSIDQHLANGHTYSVTIRILTRSGDYLWVKAQGKCFKDADEKALYLLGFFVEIPELQVKHQELELGEARFRAFMDNCHAAVFLKDARGKHIYANLAAANLAGVSLNEMLGHSNSDFMPAETAAAMDLADRNVLDTREVSVWNGPFSRPDGSERWIQDVKFPVKISNHEIALGGFGVDLTDLRESQLANETYHRLESIGRLAGGVAHDLNNMLNIILIYSDIALEELAGNQIASEYLRHVQKAGKRSAELTANLLTFARKQSRTPVILNLNETIMEVLKILKPLFGENVKIECSLSSDLATIEFDPVQLDQIMTNLLFNAKDAIDDIGRIFIETSNVAIDESLGNKMDNLTPGNYVKVSISDNGCGMDVRTQQSIFEPFYTTKPIGEGTGLGLATVHGIIKQNNCYINVDSAINKGTTFHFYIPVTEDSESQNPLIADLGLITGNGEHILLVEDEASLLEVISELLTKLGYKVTATTSAANAINLANKIGAELSLLITDVTMPEMNGYKLSEEIRSNLPDIKILLMSGYAVQNFNADDLSGNVGFIQKPMQTRDLGLVIQQLLKKPT